MKVTLQDISDATGFSVSTVSRAIRGKGRISDDNRERIIESAKDLGYNLYTIKRHQKKSTAPSIPVITKFRTGEFYSSFFAGFLDAAKEKNLNTCLYSVDPQLDEINSLIAELVKLGHAGAILFIPELKENQYRQILNNKPKHFPLLSCSNIDNTVLDTVTFDAYQGAMLITTHFYAEGYRNLGIIEGPYKMPEARFRTNGFLDFIRQNEDAKCVWDFQGDYTLESGINAFRYFQKSETKPEAIFAANDSMALGFIESAREAGYSIPDDIAIAGYDNLPFCEYHYPKITSVHSDYKLLATRAFDDLTSRFGKPDQHKGFVSLVPVSVKVRESSANKRKSAHIY